MRIKNKAAAQRAAVSPKTLSRWDKRYEEIGYAKPIYVLGQIYRDVAEIEAFERENPDFSPRKRKPPQAAESTKQLKQQKPPKQRKKDRAEQERAISRRDPRQQALSEIGGPK